MILHYILYLLLSVVFITFLFDAILSFGIWQSRIHIGRFIDSNAWADKLKEKSLKWLTRTPTIKLTDNSRLVIIDILKGNYKKQAIQYWQEASLLLGLTQTYYKTKDEKTLKTINNYVQSKIKSDGNWVQEPTEIDGVILAYAFLNADWINHDLYKPAYDAVWKLIQNLTGKDGTVKYRDYVPDLRFVDTIGFVCPFLVTYGSKFKIKEAVDLGIKQINEYNQYGMLGEHFLTFHTYNINNKLPGGLFGWGRGMGWYAIGLIDSWKALPNNHPEKENLTQNVVKFAEIALQFQNENGCWNWIVNEKSAQADSSTTATLLWLLANVPADEKNYTDCQVAIHKGLAYLQQNTRRDGAVDFSQGDTKAIGIHAQDFDVLPFTQGFVLRTINI